MKKKQLEEMVAFIRKGVFDIELSKPLKSGEKTFDKLHLDLTQLTAQDMLECEEQWVAQFGRTSTVASHSAAFHLIVASRALGIPVEDLIAGLTMRESVGVSNTVVSFLNT